MSTRTRTYSEQRTQNDIFADNTRELDTLSDGELDSLLFDDEPREEKGVLNLPTVAGLSLIMVGAAYLFQKLTGWNGLDLSALINMLPWLAGILIILLGFGVLSWRPRRGRKKVKRAFDLSSGKQKVILEQTLKGERRRLAKSRNKKIAGVCAGIAEYFAIDPTLVRIAAVIGALATNGALIVAYIIMAYILPKADVVKQEERITIIRDL